jgi:hypothetical protein
MTVKDFQYRGRNVRRVSIDPRREFAAGVDLGKSIDATMVAVVEYTSVGLGTFDKRDSTVVNGLDIYQERFRETYDVRSLIKIPLGTGYDAVIAQLDYIIHQEPLVGCALVVDHGGIGAVFCDLLENQTNLTAIRVHSTGGDEARRIKHNHWSVPKITLVSLLAGLFASERIRIASDLPNLEVLRREAQNFVTRYSATGRPTFDAAIGEHDDALSAIALAVWRLWTQHSPTFSGHRGGDYFVGTVRGMF